MNSQTYREVQAKVIDLIAEGNIAPDFDLRQSIEVLRKEISKGLRKKRNKKYEQSKKGKARKMAWNKVQSYYKTDICVMCGKEKRIVSKGRCDACRRKK